MNLNYSQKKYCLVLHLTNTIFFKKILLLSPRRYVGLDFILFLYEQRFLLLICIKVNSIAFISLKCVTSSLSMLQLSRFSLLGIKSWLMP